MATLSVGSWFSSCEACGGNADPYEEAHNMVTMVGEGCGVVFTAITASTIYPGFEARLKEMRPDLPYVGWGVDE